MGIKTSGLEVIKQLLPAPSVLSLSYPDLLCSVDDIEEIFGFTTEKFNDSGKWHGLDHLLPETMDVFSKLGSTLRCVDIVASRNIEEVVDLNYPHDLGKYDLVLDCGTTEHCFNVGQALMNAANAVNDGGYIFHTPPLTMTNHGFYCLQPTLFYDFYTQNGWEILALTGETKNKWFEVSPIARMQLPPETSLCVVARRNGLHPLQFPMQHKYRKHPQLK